MCLGGCGVDGRWVWWWWTWLSHWRRSQNHQPCTRLSRAMKQGRYCLWNAEANVKTLATAYVFPGSPSDDDDGNDDDDNGCGGNSDAGGLGSSPRCSPPPDTSNPQGGTRGAPGNETLPPSDPKKPTKEVEDKPAHLTTEELTAFNIAEDFKYTTTFERYTMSNLTMISSLLISE